MLYLHGGGYVGGSIWTHRKMVGQLAKAIGCYALLATYDYAFQSKFPRQIEQTVKAFEWLAQQGIAPKHILGAGDSAGAGLVPFYRDAFRVLVLRRCPDDVARRNGWLFHTDGVHLNSRAGRIVADRIQALQIRRGRSIAPGSC